MPARPRRPYRLRLVLVPALVGLWLALIGAAPASAAVGYSRDLYFIGSYERQVDSRTCTAASTAMMMNLLDRTDLNLPQLSILRFEQSRDALWDARQRGSDPLGWSRAASYFSRYTAQPTTYRWEAYPSRTAALKRAASQIAAHRQARRARDPARQARRRDDRDPDEHEPGEEQGFSLVSIAVSDPYGYSHRWYTASSYPLTPTWSSTRPRPTTPPGTAST